MELDPDEPRVVGKLNRLRQQAVGRHAREYEAFLFQALSVGGIDLVAMPVALGNLGVPVNRGDTRAWLEIGSIGAKTHRAAEIAGRLPLLELGAAQPLG